MVPAGCLTHACVTGRRPCTGRLQGRRRLRGGALENMRLWLRSCQGLSARGWEGGRGEAGADDGLRQAQVYAWPVPPVCSGVEPRAGWREGGREERGTRNGHVGWNCGTSRGMAYARLPAHAPVVLALHVSWAAGWGTQQGMGPSRRSSSASPGNSHPGRFVACGWDCPVAIVIPDACLCAPSSKRAVRARKQAPVASPELSAVEDVSRAVAMRLL